MNGLGDYSAVYLEQSQACVKAHRRILRSGGAVEAAALSADGERIEFLMSPGETWLVR